MKKTHYISYTNFFVQNFLLSLCQNSVPDPNNSFNENLKKTSEAEIFVLIKKSERVNEDLLIIGYS